MTEREKYIDALKDLKEWLITFSNGSHVKEIEAIDYAISSLKTDLAYDLEYERTTKNDVSENNVGKIKPKGHWIMTNDYLTTAYGSIDYVKCSCCGEDSLEEGNYCPNCGSDNREVKV